MLKFSHERLFGRGNFFFFSTGEVLPGIKSRNTSPWSHIPNPWKRQFLRHSPKNEFQSQSHMKGLLITHRESIMYLEAKKDKNIFREIFMTVYI